MVVCQEILEYVQEMIIDEERDDVLTNYQIKKKDTNLFLVITISCVGNLPLVSKGILELLEKNSTSSNVQKVRRILERKPAQVVSFHLALTMRKISNSVLNYSSKLSRRRFTNASKRSGSSQETTDN